VWFKKLEVKIKR